MYYNLLKFPNINSARIAYLEEIVQHVQPDIFVVNELTSASGASTILSSAMNTGPIVYNAATYVSGPDDNNMLYYNSAKLGIIDENVIATSLRDINEYVLYYKDPGLTAQSDTTYLFVYGLHLKAGNSQDDADRRGDESAVLRSYLNTRPWAENTIVGGDFNIYYSSEEAYNNLTGSTQADLHDEIGAGAWHNNNIYANVFTQSTRTTSFDGGATGGMDDRFDMILFSDDMINGANGAQYKSNSYTAIGQDGLRWNSSLVTPTNNSEPANIINALYYMSDHLPVYMEIEVGGEVGLNEEHTAHMEVYPNPTNGLLTIEMNAEGYDLSVIDMQGREVHHQNGLAMGKNEVDLSELNAGTYFLKTTSTKGQSTKKLMIR